MCPRMLEEMHLVETSLPEVSQVMGWLDGSLAAVWVAWGADSQGPEAARLSSVVGLSAARLFSISGIPNSSVVFHCANLQHLGCLRCGIIKRQGRGCIG